MKRIFISTLIFLPFCGLRGFYWESIACHYLAEHLKNELQKPYDASRDFPLLTYVQCPMLLKIVLDKVVDKNNPIHQGLLKRALRHAVMIDNIESAQILIDFGVSVTSASGDPINYVTSSEMVYLLVKHGAQVNRTEGYSTPLYWAADSGHIEAVETLLKLKADPSLIDRKNNLSLKEWLQHKKEMAQRYHDEKLIKLYNEMSEAVTPFLR
jgi:hypothetical protein